MRRLLTAIVCTLVIPASGIAGELLFVSASLRAMACCAAAKGECAGWKSPHQCCETRDAVVASVAPAPLTAARDAVAVADAWIAVALPLAARPAPGFSIASLRFKRPHDPPHLHGFTLLI